MTTDVKVWVDLDTDKLDRRIRDMRRLLLDKGCRVVVLDTMRTRAEVPDDSVDWLLDAAQELNHTATQTSEADRFGMLSNDLYQVACGVEMLTQKAKGNHERQCKACASVTQRLGAGDIPADTISESASGPEKDTAADTVESAPEDGELSPSDKVVRPDPDGEERIFPTAPEDVMRMLQSRLDEAVVLAEDYEALLEALKALPEINARMAELRKTARGHRAMLRAFIDDDA